MGFGILALVAFDREVPSVLDNSIYQFVFLLIVGWFMAGQPLMKSYAKTLSYAGTSDAYLVKYEVSQSGHRTGSDVAKCWLEDGFLHFSGLRAEFRIASNQVLNAGSPLQLITQEGLPTLSIKARVVNSCDHDQFFLDLRQLRSSKSMLSDIEVPMRIQSYSATEKAIVGLQIAGGSFLLVGWFYLAVSLLNRPYSAPAKFAILAAFILMVVLLGSFALAPLIRERMGLTELKKNQERNGNSFSKLS